MRFPTAGGSEIEGWFVPGDEELPFGIALVHGAGEDRRAFLDHLPFLHEAGFALLFFDLRQRGAADGAAGTTGLAGCTLEVRAGEIVGVAGVEGNGQGDTSGEPINDVVFDVARTYTVTLVVEDENGVESEAVTT